MKNKRFLVIAVLCVIVASLLISPVGKTIQKAINPTAERLDKSEMVSYDINNLTLQENNDPEKGHYGKFINVPIDYRPNTRGDFETLVNAAGYTYYEVSEGLDNYDGDYHKGDSAKVREETFKLVDKHSASNTTVVINAASYFWGGWTASHGSYNYALPSEAGFNAQWADLENLISNNSESNYYINFSVPRSAPLINIWGYDFDNERMLGVDGSEVTAYEGILQYIWIHYYIHENGIDPLPDNMKNYYNNFLVNNPRYTEVIKGEINKYERFMSYLVKAVEIKNKYSGTRIDLIVSAGEVDGSSYIKSICNTIENGSYKWNDHHVIKQYSGIKNVLDCLDVNNAYAWKDEATGLLYGNVFNILHTVHDVNQLILSRELSRDTGIGVHYQMKDLKTGKELDGDNGLWNKIHSHNASSWGSSAETFGFLTTGQQIVEKDDFINHETRSDLTLGQTVTFIKRQNICVYLNSTIFNKEDNTWSDYLNSDEEVQAALNYIKNDINKGEIVQIIDLYKSTSEKSKQLYQAIIESGNLFKLAGFNNAFFYSGNNTIGIGLVQSHVQSILEFAYENKITGKDTFNANRDLHNYLVRLIKLNEQKLKAITKDWSYSKYVALTDAYSVDTDQKIMYTNGVYAGANQGTSIRELFNNTQVEFGKITYQFEAVPSVVVKFPWNGAKHSIDIKFNMTGKLWLGGRSDYGTPALNISAPKLTVMEGNIISFKANSNVANAEIKFDIKDKNIAISKDKTTWYTSSNINSFGSVKSDEVIYIKGVNPTGDTPSRLITYLDYTDPVEGAKHVEVATSVTVNKNGTEELRLSAYNFEIDAGDTIQITAYSNIENANITWYCLDADTKDMIWETRTSKSGETQSYKFNKKRNVLIQVSTSKNGKSHVANAYVTVKGTETTPTPGNEFDGVYININPNRAAYGSYLNETRDFSAEVKKYSTSPYRGNLDNLEIIWESSKTSVATVTSTNKGRGLSITGKKAGQAIIIGHLKDAPSIKKEIKVTVYDEEKPVEEENFYIIIEGTSNLRKDYWAGEKLDYSNVTFKKVTNLGKENEKRVDLTKDEVKNKIVWKANTDDFTENQLVLTKEMTQVELWYKGTGNSEQGVGIISGKTYTGFTHHINVSTVPSASNMNLKVIHGSFNTSSLRPYGMNYSEVGNQINVFVERDGSSERFDFSPILVVDNKINEAMYNKSSNGIIKVTANGNELKDGGYEIEDEFSIVWGSNGYKIYCEPAAIGKSYKIKAEVKGFESTLNKEFTINVKDKSSSTASIKTLSVSGEKVWETKETIKKGYYTVVGISEDGSERVLDISEYKLEFLNGNSVVKTIAEDKNDLIKAEDVKACDAVAITAYSITNKVPFKVVTSFSNDEEKEVVIITGVTKQASYDQNYMFSPSDFTITALYSDGTSQVVTADEVTIIGKGTTSPVALVKYKGITTRIPITINSGGTPTAGISSIKITTPPNKTSYVVGEIFDKTGMVVKAVYTDGSEVIIPNTDYMFTPSLPLQESNTSITITYTDIAGNSFTATQPITVTASGGGVPTTGTISSIKITTPPNKTSYVVGEIFDKTGMVVKAVYTDGSEVIIPNTDYMFTPSLPLQESDTNITITYTDTAGNVFTVVQAITVTKEGGIIIPPTTTEITSIKITTPPTKTNYVAGEVFNPAGMKVVAVFADGSEVEIPSSMYEVAPGLELQVSDTKITVTFTNPENGKTFTANQPITVTASGGGGGTTPPPATTGEYDRIYVATSPIKVIYVEGENFMPAGMVVKGVRKDGTVEILSSYTIMPARPLSTTDRFVTIVYVDSAGNSYTAQQVVTVMSDTTSTVNFLTGLEITTPPTKVEYKEGEVLNVSGMVVTAHYYDGTSKEVSYYSVNPKPGMKLTKGDKEFTVTYTEDGITRTVVQPIKVTSGEKVLTRIKVTTPPNKVKYLEGETLDRTGMVVEAVYDDDTSKVITDYTIEPSGILTKDDTTMTIKYTEKGVTMTATLSIEVTAKDPESVTLTEIKMTTPATKTSYTEGESFDKTGMVVVAVYSDGTVQEVTNKVQITPAKLTVSDKKVVVTYTENGVTKTVEQQVEVIAPELEAITIKTAPTKVEYVEGQVFDKKGMVVIAKYSNGAEKEITSYTYEPKEALTTEDTKVSITYTENGITKTAEQVITVVEKELVSIRIKTEPVKKSYIEGQTFTTEGMVIVAKYNDGTEKVVTDYTVSPATKLTPEDTEVTITYEEDDVVKTVIQPIKVVAKAKVAINYSITKLTKEDVIVTIEADQVITNAEVEKAEEWKTSSDGKSIYKVFKENGEEEVVVTTEDGETHEFDVKVDNIDKTPLEVDVEYKYNKEDNTVTVTITSNREINEYSVNDRDGWKLSEDKLKLEKTYTKNAEETIVIEDILENKSETELEITQVKTPAGDNTGNNDNNNDDNNDNNNNGGNTGNQNNGQSNSNGNNSSQSGLIGGDTTTSNKILPATGIKTIALTALLIMTLTGAVAFIKYKKMKNMIK